TMLLAGWRALREYDLKLILAFGTVSQLGLITVMVGSGGSEMMLAGLAMPKKKKKKQAALFMVVGIVDHATGTRDIRRLAGLGALGGKGLPHPSARVREMHVPDAGFLAPPAVLAAAGLLFGLLPSVVDEALSDYADTIPDPPGYQGGYHLALWHGLTLPLGLS